MPGNHKSSKASDTNASNSNNCDLPSSQSLTGSDSGCLDRNDASPQEQYSPSDAPEDLLYPSLAYLKNLIEGSLPSGSSPLMLSQLRYGGKTLLLDSLFRHLQALKLSNDPNHCYPFFISCKDCDPKKDTSPKEWILRQLTRMFIAPDNITRPVESMCWTEEIVVSLLNRETAGRKFVLIMDDVDCLCNGKSPSFTHYLPEVREFLKTQFIDVQDRCLIYSTTAPLDLDLGSPPTVIEMPQCLDMSKLKEIWAEQFLYYPVTRMVMALYGGVPSLIYHITTKQGCSQLCWPDPRYDCVGIPEVIPFHTMDLLRSVVKAFITGELIFPHENPSKQLFEGSLVARTIQAHSTIVVNPSTVDTNAKTSSQKVSQSSSLPYLHRWPLRYIGLILEDIQYYTECDGFRNGSKDRCSRAIDRIQSIASIRLLALEDCPDGVRTGKDFEFIVTVGLMLWLTFVCINDSDRGSIKKFPLSHLFSHSSFHPHAVDSFNLTRWTMSFLDDAAAKVIRDTVEKDDMIYHFRPDDMTVCTMHSYIAHRDSESGNIVVQGILSCLDISNPELSDIIARVEHCLWVNLVYIISARHTERQSRQVSGKVVIVGTEDIDKLLGFSLSPLRALFRTDAVSAIVNKRRTR